MFKERDVLLSTVHGSNLYGLATSMSDLDNYVVVSESQGKVKPKQTIIDNVDTTVIGFNIFMKQVYEGVPQALEALYSPYADIDLLNLRKNYFCNSDIVVNTYLRTIKNFTLDDRHPYRYRKHALRLTYNLNSILTYGFFNPVLTEDNKNNIMLVPELTDEDFFNILEETSVLGLNFIESTT